MMVGNQPEREIILDANQPIEFNTIKDAINAVIGTNYAGWMKACWPNVMGNGSFRLWFLSLHIMRMENLMLRHLGVLMCFHRIGIDSFLTI